jgi:hypothetical protein
LAARRSATCLAGPFVVTAAARGDCGKRDHEGGEQDPEPAGPALSGFSHRSSSF